MSGLFGVRHGSEVVEVGRPSVPVHHDDVHVLLLGQQVHDVVDPDWWRSGGSVAVDDEGGGPTEVEERLGGQVVVVYLAATIEVGAGVEEQSYVQAGSHEAMGQVQVSEVVAGARSGFHLTWSTISKINIKDGRHS